jgi:DUF1365 family protein
MKHPQLLTGQVMHQRHQPRARAFRYGIYYVALPLTAWENGTLDAILPARRFAHHSFLARDHGARDGSNLHTWAIELLARYDVPAPMHITLLCLPRVLGYVFNPVSFWLCYDATAQLIAVLCEVNNTFGETHTYLCVHPDRRPLQSHDWLTADKCFHVSPFLPRTGEYRFRFALDENHCRIDIHYVNNKDLTLTTCLQGHWQPLTQTTLRRAFWRYPLVTLKAIAMIHYQALRLVARRIAYIPRPPQQAEQISCTAQTALRTTQQPSESDVVTGAGRTP